MRTKKSRAMATAAVLRLSGAVYHYLYLPWSTYPWKALRLVDPCRNLVDERDEFMGTCGHVLDVFALSLRSQFPTAERLASQTCFPLLLLMLILVHITIARIECRHATIRRLLAMWGAIWHQDLPYISAAFVAIRTRQIQLDTCRMSSQAGSEEDGATGKWSHGGACRAFFSEYWSSSECQQLEDMSERARLEHAKYRRTNTTDNV